MYIRIFISNFPAVNQLARLQEPRLDSVPPVMAWPWAIPSMPRMYQMPGMFAPYFMLPPQTSSYMEHPSHHGEEDRASVPSAGGSEEAQSPPSKIRKCDTEASNGRCVAPSHEKEAKTVPAVTNTPAIYKKVPRVHEDKPAGNAEATAPRPNPTRNCVTADPRHPSRPTTDSDESAERDYECGQCRMRTRSHHGLKRHLDSHGNGLPMRPAVCARCRQQFLNVFDLYFHVLSHYKGDKNNNGDPVEVQGMPQAAMKELEDKVYSHNKAAKKSFPRLFECGECRLRVRSNCGLRRHFKKHPSLCPLPAVCGVCKTAFPNTVQLQEHMMSHSDTVPNIINGRLRRLACQFCEETFVTADALSQHIVSHEREESALPLTTK